jgi:hypothetical protein
VIRLNVFVIRAVALIAGHIALTGHLALILGVIAAVGAAGRGCTSGCSIRGGLRTILARCSGLVGVRTWQRRSKN